MFVVCDHLIRTINLIDQFGVYPEFVGLTSHVNPPTICNIHVLGTDVGVIAILVALLRQYQLLRAKGRNSRRRWRNRIFSVSPDGGSYPLGILTVRVTGGRESDQLEWGHPERRVKSGIVRKH
jgi:hypothetical protein